MFLPAFFTGSLISRFGVLRVIAIGAIFEIGCALVNFSGITFANFVIANVLVGVGLELLLRWRVNFVDEHVSAGRKSQGAGDARLSGLFDDGHGCGCVGNTASDRWMVDG